jgi:hypothetical protein
MVPIADERQHGAGPARSGRALPSNSIRNFGLLQLERQISAIYFAALRKRA